MAYDAVSLLAAAPAEIPKQPREETDETQEAEAKRDISYGPIVPARHRNGDNADKHACQRPNTTARGPKVRNVHRHSPCSWSATEEAATATADS